jgi:hypothetical protein
MSIKSKVFAAAATLTLVGGVGAASALTAGTAGAATPACGWNCIDIFSHNYGTHRHPGFVLDVLRQRVKVGQPVILFRTGNSDPAEDFTVAYQGRVSDFAAAQLVSPALALHYGGGCKFFDIRRQTCTKYWPNDYAYEIEYAPYGVDSGLCAGVATTAAEHTPVSLRPCGASARTVWIVDIAHSTGRSLFHLYVPLINGSDTNFSHPFVLTYPKNAHPTDLPRPQLRTQTLQQFSNGGLVSGGSVNANQEWGGDFGPLR